MARDRQDKTLLDALESLLEMPAEDLALALANASDLVASSLGADKVDVFLLDTVRDSLVAYGSSAQPLSALQRQHGLDVLPLSNGGRAAYSFQTGETFVTGHLDEDPEELRGVKEALAVRSTIAVPLVIDGAIRGVLLVAAQGADAFDDDDVRFAESFAHWISIVARRAELVETIARSASEEGRRTGADELITVLAHDLRNHLAPLGMRLHNLRERAAQEGREREVVELSKAQANVERIVALITDILDVSRLDQGLFHLERRPLDLVDLCHEIATALSTPEQRVDVRAAAGACWAAVDAGRIKQCLENVVTNAIKHSPRHAPVTVEVMPFLERDGPWVRIDVVDEGPGVPPDILPRIFERGVTSGDGRQKGLGLGLYLARCIAELHGGRIEVEARGGAPGARFVLKLPAGIVEETALAEAGTGT